MSATCLTTIGSLLCKCIRRWREAYADTLFRWEDRDGDVKPLSGQHHLFLSGDATPQKISAATSNGEANASNPITILYDTKNASLVYDCQEAGVIRRSISLDFHLHITPSDELSRLSEFREGSQVEGMEIIDLLTSCPEEGYEVHFQRLLCNPKSLAAMVQMLSRIDPPAPCYCAPPSNAAFSKRVDDYKRDNVASIPPEILNFGKDIQVSGIYSTPMVFLQNLTTKACRDVHLPLGWDLFPYKVTDDIREVARKYFRDMSEKSVGMRIGAYMSTLMKTPYSSQDLLSTAQLQGLAEQIVQGSLELMTDGYVSIADVLLCILSFVQALGRALNGPNEAQGRSESWFDESGLHLYRTRCLYLFWCVDFLLDYLEKPIEGPFMMMRMRKEDIASMRVQGESMARMLLRNWVAWGLFVEGLPKGGFRVKKASA